jgi:DNA invertase Pin-like site-specific DNA recombinase
MAPRILPENVAVLLLRMSFTKQDVSIPAQRDELIKLAKRKGYQVLREYADEAISGDDTERRDGFLRLRTDCENGPDFSIILCWHEDRLSRNDPLELGYWLKPIRDSGVVVETPAGRVDWESLGGRLIYLIEQEMRHDYLRTLSRNVSRGFLAAANKRRTGTGGRAPRGYRHVKEIGAAGKVVDVETVVDPEEAAIVRRIFRDYLMPGASLRSVADGLNRDGILAARGNPWTLQAVRYVLRNRKYCGDYVRFRYRVGKFTGVVDGEIVSRRKADGLAEVEPMVVRNNHKGIIDRRTFEAAQAKLATRKRDTAHRTGRRYLFSGLLRCGDCGLVMGGQPHQRHPEKLFYRCQTYGGGGRGACYSNSVGEDAILDCIVRVIEREYLSEKAIERLTTKFRKLASRRAVVPIDAGRLRKRIEDLDRQVDRGADRVLSAPETLVGTIYAKLERLRRERDRLQAELNAAVKPETGSDGGEDEKVEEAVAALRDLRSAFKDADREDLREMLRQLIVKVEVEFTHQEHNGRTKNVPRGGTLLIRPDKTLAPLMSISPATSSHPR